MEGKCTLSLVCVLVEFLLGIKMKMWDDLKYVGQEGGGGVGGGEETGLFV